MGIKQRLDRLEDEIGMKPESRVTVITIDPHGVAQEGPYSVQLSPKIWASALRGGPFTSEEVRQLREEEAEREERTVERKNP